MAATSIDKLTLGEISVIEDLSNQAIDQIGEPGAPKGRLFAAMVYVVKLRTDPTFTFNDAMGLDMSEIENIIDLSDDEAPAPKALPAKKRATKD